MGEKGELWSASKVLEYFGDYGFCFIDVESLERKT